jgi:LuxR family maltose regulon positive regulatory protein
MTYLLDHLPALMRLVLLTRADPALPLPRLRAHGQLTEIRAADLRFSLDEAASFLNRVMGLSLTSEQVAALEAHTEGWITGLQLAALSMQDQKDVQGFISAFTGSHRYIVDFLAEEVLNRQPEAVRDFLLRTSILDRMVAPLCNVLTNRSD